MPDPPALLGGLTVEKFLRRHWQKKPLLIRQALPGFRHFITPEALAGLAAAENVNSRLVIEKGARRPWQVTHGPLTARDFHKLPRTHWTLLVTDVDKLLPAAADLLDCFAFIPNWRIDDVMVSHAADRGSVGPHVDSYDVFLLQAQGRRRWQLSARKYGPDDFVPGLELRILGDFRPDEEWVLEPGDMLYLPPGVAHCGIAEGDCMTCSIGFRAPGHREIVSEFADHVAGRFDPDARYRDASPRRPRHSGEIDLSARRQVHRLIRAATAQDSPIDDWLGRYLTETGPWGAPTPPRRPLTVKQFRQRWEKRRTLFRSLRCRFAFIRRGSRCTLYMDAEAFPLPRALAFAAPLLSGQRRFDFEILTGALRRAGFLPLLCDLYNKGYVGFTR